MVLTLDLTSFNCAIGPQTSKGTAFAYGNVVMPLLNLIQGPK